jgi:hypothetical protein
METHNDINNKLIKEQPRKINKKLIKINDKTFKILKFNEYQELYNYDYNVKYLKLLCKYYKLKISGNKNELTKRIYNFLLNSYYAVLIQKNIRRFFVKQYFYLHGEALFKRQLCVNSTDFYSLDDLSDIPFNQFYSFKDNDNFIYGFDICSIFNLWQINKEQTKNPYNRNLLPKNTISNLKKIKRYSRILKIPFNIELDTEDYFLNMDPETRLNSDFVSLFAKIDELGYYTDSSWLTSLSRNNLIYFYRHLYDIWDYRLQLTNDIKRRICPLTLTPFINHNIHYLHIKSDYEIKKAIYDFIKNLISNGIEQSDRWLGASYVLSALTLVSSDAANALPWLYESVAPNNLY